MKTYSGLRDFEGDGFVTVMVAGGMPKRLWGDNSSFKWGPESNYDGYTLAIALIDDVIDDYSIAQNLAKQFQKEFVNKFEDGWVIDFYTIDEFVQKNKEKENE